MKKYFQTIIFVFRNIPKLSRSVSTSIILVLRNIYAYEEKNIRMMMAQVVALQLLLLNVKASMFKLIVLPSPIDCIIIVLVRHITTNIVYGPLAMQEFIRFTRLNPDGATPSTDAPRQ